MNKRLSLLVVLFVITLLPVRTGAQETAAQDTVACRQVLMLGPLPLTSASSDSMGILRGTNKMVPEVTVERLLPPNATRGWQEQSVDGDGRFPVSEPGVYWIAARLRTSAYTKATLNLDHGSALYSEGTELTVQPPGDTADFLSAPVTLTRGWVTVFGRVILAADDLAFALTAAADSVAEPLWTLTDAIALTRFGDTDQVASVGSLAVADSGKLVARYYSRSSDHTHRLDMLDDKGRTVAADVGGGRMRPVGFLPHSTRLLLRRGNNLISWQAPDGPQKTVLKDETGLDLIKVSPSGRWLLFASQVGFSGDDPKDGPGRRYRHFRERIQDYTPENHLHLLDLKTGVRRILTRPGDFVLDDAVFSADETAVIYGRTLPQAPRPWFTSEIRRIDLKTGDDTLITGFTSGWEVRPRSFATSPDGKQLVFIGPPQEVVADPQAAPQHNVYNTQVWLVDLQGGQYRRITAKETYAFEGGSGFPVFSDRNHLLVKIVDGSVNRLARLSRGEVNWPAEALPQQGGCLGAVALSPDSHQVVYTASSPDRPAGLYLAETGKTGRLLEDPNVDLDQRTLWAAAQDMSFTGPGGETIDAWYFPPLQMNADGGGVFRDPDQGQSPLIVYYYGGSSATQRSFNTTFQFLAAAGYGVLAVNPRGATGYGEAFADHHAGDWGPDAAGDVMAATEHVLAAHPYLDRGAMGIYGGSYGGFMTDYLVTHTDMYSAAVSMYGISDLVTYFGQGAWGVTYGDMALGGRNPWDDPQYFIDHSPVYQANQVKTPLLLLHGLADTNVTTGESIQLFTELSVLDKPVEMVLFPDEDHGISGTWKNRVAHRTMLLEWFDRWLKRQPAAWEARWK